MEAQTVYNWLFEAPRSMPCDAADAHVMASVIAVAVQEAEPGGTLTAGLGLSGADLRDLIFAFYPHAVSFLERFHLNANVSLSEDERCLRDLLSRHTTRGSWFELRLAALMARRAMRANHLWQDLGLRNRLELSDLMARHFAPLATRNHRDMKWKKFFYRMICKDEGFRLCTAPSCSECDDFAVCFGDESGESLLARIRRDAETQIHIDVPLMSLTVA